MPQSARFGAVRSFRGVGKGKQLNLVAGAGSQIEFVGVPRFPKGFLDDRKAQDVCIEFLGFFVIGANDGYMMDAGGFHKLKYSVADKRGCND